MSKALKTVLGLIAGLTAGAGTGFVVGFVFQIAGWPGAGIVGAFGGLLVTFAVFQKITGHP